jgi:hypothetical protein
MFILHHTKRAALARNASPFKGREEHRFFFPVMIAVGEFDHELYDFEESACGNHIPAFEPAANSVQRAQAALDGAMLVFEDMKW